MLLNSISWLDSVQNPLHIVRNPDEPLRLTTVRNPRLNPVRNVPIACLLNRLHHRPRLIVVAPRTSARIRHVPHTHDRFRHVLLLHIAVRILGHIFLTLLPGNQIEHRSLQKLGIFAGLLPTGQDVAGVDAIALFRTRRKTRRLDVVSATDVRRHGQPCEH